MSTGTEIEIYRQRYETFRHLDKLRWQMLQIAIAVAPLVLAFSIRTQKPIPEWLWIGVGALILVCGLVMAKINDGVRSNAVSLKSAAEAIGDTGQPAPHRRAFSMSFWVSLILRLTGATLITVFFIRSISQ